jgi:hypothetical protein
MEPYFNPEDPTFSDPPTSNEPIFQLPSLGGWANWSNLLDTVKTQTKQVVDVYKRCLSIPGSFLEI